MGAVRRTIVVAGHRRRRTCGAKADGSGSHGRWHRGRRSNPNDRGSPRINTPVGDASPAAALAGTRAAAGPTRVRPERACGSAILLVALVRRVLLDVPLPPLDGQVAVLGRLDAFGHGGRHIAVRLRVRRSAHGRPVGGRDRREVGFGHRIPLGQSARGQPGARVPRTYPGRSGSPSPRRKARRGNGGRGRRTVRTGRGRTQAVRVALPRVLRLVAAASSVWPRRHPGTDRRHTGPRRRPPRDGRGGSRWRTTRGETARSTRTGKPGAAWRRARKSGPPRSPRAPSRPAATARPTRGTAEAGTIQAGTAPRGSIGRTADRPTHRRRLVAPRTSGSRARQSRGRHAADGQRRDGPAFRGWPPKISRRRGLRAAGRCHHREATRETRRPGSSPRRPGRARR